MAFLFPGLTMPVRKAISKKMRFEVFKRDSFKCQYCGRSAPEVILHVDHINPVARGGKNELVNYATACSECNLGKGARKLTDSDEMQKQKQELDILNDRREQLGMMMEWRNELSKISELEIDIVNDAIESAFMQTLTAVGRSEIAKTIKKYGLNDVLDAIDKHESVFNRGKDIVTFIDATCHFHRVDKEKPYMRDMYYIRGILMNRLKDFSSMKYECISKLESMYLSGVSMEAIKDAARVSNTWDEFLSVAM